MFPCNTYCVTITGNRTELIPRGRSRKKQLLHKYDILPQIKKHIHIRRLLFYVYFYTNIKKILTNKYKLEKRFLLQTIKYYTFLSDN